MNLATREGVTPPYYSSDDMAAVLKIIRKIGDDGISGIRLSTNVSDIVAGLSRDAEQNIAQLVGVHHKSLGSVEGMIEIVSIRKGRRRFNILHTRTQKSIRCTLPEEFEHDVFDATEHRRRVVVSGMVSYNVKGKPIKVQIQKRLRYLRGDEELPTPDDILGAILDITGKLTTEEHIRSLRNG